ncbi:MAG: tetratricopeptide repeat protein [Deltaproteobacteria bacterium]|nr:MAG: tetratricopeptide repeat protein [Deltaproteobacteria bacterium]
MRQVGTRVAAGVLLGLAVALGIALNGAVAPWAQAVVLTLLLAALGLALLTRRMLAASPTPSATVPEPSTRGWLVPTALLALLALFCLLSPLTPTGLDRLTFGSGGLLLAIPATMTLALISPRKSVRIERIAAWSLLALGALVLAHKLLAPPTLYGLIPLRTQAYDGWAPLVNPNFNATLAVVLLPLALKPLLHPKGHPSHRLGLAALAGLAGLAGLALIVGTGSLGAILAVLCVLLLGLSRLLPTRLSWAGLPAVVALTALVFAAGGWLDTNPDGPSSAAQRLDQWGRSLRMLWDYPIAGVGLGGYGEIFTTYQDPYRNMRFDHAHSDPIQWLTEGGSVGAVALGLAAFVVWPRSVYKVNSRATLIELGLAGGLIHSFVDFPLQLPGLALLFSVLLAWRHTVYEPAPRWSLPTLGLVALVATLLGISVTTHRAWVEATVSTLSPRLERDPTAAESLLALAPLRPEPRWMLATRLADPTEDPERARSLCAKLLASPHRDHESLFRCGLVSLTLGDLESGRSALERASQRGAADHRPRAVLSRIAEADGDREAALRWWTEAVQRWPHERVFTQGVFERALRLMPVGLYWVEALRDGPSPPLSLYLGIHLLKQNDPESALLAFEQAAFLRPSYAEGAHHGRALLEVGRTDEGLAHLSRVGVNHDSPDAWRFRAEALAELGRHDEAIVDARRALRLNPDDPRSATLLLDTLQTTGGPTAVLSEAKSLPPGQARRHPHVALRIARAAEERMLWSVCVDWLRQSQETTAPQLYERCVSACSFCD